MARIAGVDLPRQKHINIALTYIYGIGHPRAGSILDEAKVDPMKKVQDLNEEEVNRIRTVIAPELNQQDIDDIPEHLRKTLNFVFVSTVDQVLGVALNRRRNKGYRVS